jgi:cytochrome c
MRRIVIAAAGLLLAGSATTALAAVPAAGERIFKAQCGICHTVAAGENRIGPTLFGVVGRPAAAFQASTTPPTTRSSASPGTPPPSDKYLTNPRAMVPDTSMVYAGLKDDAERAELVAYIETLH